MEQNKINWKKKTKARVNNMEKKDRTMAELVAEVKGKHLEEYDDLIEDVEQKVLKIKEMRDWINNMNNNAYIKVYVVKGKYFLIAKDRFLRNQGSRYAFINITKNEYKNSEVIVKESESE